MAVLAINCTTENLCLAIITTHPPTPSLENRGGEFERCWTGPTIKAENLVIFLDELLKEANISIKDITKIGIASGPGAFTGLRLSVTTAKTIALAQQIPLIAISTLEALAYQYKEKAENQNIRIVLDACRGDVSTALFTSDISRLEPDHPIKQEAVPQEQNTLLVLNPVPDALTIAKLAAASDETFNKEKILALVPTYSHESRINYTDKPELQHLKIGMNHKPK